MSDDFVPKLKHPGDYLPPSRAKSPSGRETSFGLPTSGHKGWMPIVFKNDPYGNRPDREGYKNVVTNEEYIPDGGWKDPPPGLTGEPVRHAGDAYREGYDKIEWHTGPNGNS